MVLLARVTPDGSLLLRDAPAGDGAPQRDLIVGLLLVGFGLKAGLVPLHWMALAHGGAMPAPRC
jgi:formate hydrogenlyase subunit 3/multisubunit Na+/H+ antiporter MnhD subunit